MQRHHRILISDALNNPSTQSHSTCVSYQPKSEEEKGRRKEGGKQGPGGGGGSDDDGRRGGGAECTID